VHERQASRNREADTGTPKQQKSIEKRTAHGKLRSECNIEFFIEHKQDSYDYNHGGLRPPSLFD
jgi:hypothetical protein